MSSKLQAALAWARRGFRVFPIMEGAKKPALIDDFPRYASTDEAQIMAWWRDPISGMERNHNIGVSTTGMIVVDLDNKADAKGLDAWLDLGGPLDTLTVRTPRGGYHLYFSGPDRINSQGDTGGIARGVDTRGWHGYVLAPGSEVAEGAYSLDVDAPLAYAPDWLVGRLRAPEERDRSADLGLDENAGAEFARDWLRTAAPLAVEGAGGDNTTYQVVCRLRDYGVSEATALLLLLDEWNERCSPPWDRAELQAKVENAYRYAQNPEGARHPEAIFGNVTIPPIEEPVEAAVAPATAERTLAIRFGNLIALDVLPPREWVMYPFLLRRESTTLIAPGAVGKSQLTLLATIHLVMGQDFVGFKNKVGPCRAILYNAEDTLHEMSLRLHAQCHAMNLDPRTVQDRIALIDKSTGRLRIAIGGRRMPVEPHWQNIGLLQEAAAQIPDLAMISLDPVAKLHEANENDNSEMTDVMTAFDELAVRTNTALLLPIHTAKANPEDSRGASAIRDSVRAAFVIGGVSETDVLRYNIKEDERWRFMRMDVNKANRAPGRDPTRWFERVNVQLLNGEQVGALLPVDLSSRTQHETRRMAAMLADEMEASGVAAVALATAVQILQAAQPIYAQLDPKAVRTRLEHHLSTPCELENGRTVQAISDGGKKQIVIR